MLPTLIVGGRHSVFQVALEATRMSTLKVVRIWELLKPQSTGMSTTTVDRILVALKATLSSSIVDGRHIVFQWLGSSRSYRNLSS